MPVKKYLAIDYGTKRIGLAVNFSYLVEPLFVLDNNLTRDEPIVSQIALESIAKLCREKAIEEIVLGLSEAVMAEKTQLFAGLLQTKLALPIHLVDETLSSQEVAERLEAAAASLKKRQGPIDHYAAALILEEFLDAVLH